VAGATARRGYAGRADRCCTDVSTQHNRIHPTASRPRPSVRCLRHHVWLAACGDCREAHADLIAGRPGAPAAR
jgi:hypothetical protein